MNSPSICVVIPTTGDRPALLDRALQTVIQQHHAADEIIVACDPSMGLYERVRAQVYPRAQVIEAHAQGVSAVRNAGGAHTTCEFIAFLDDDDMWSADHLATIFARGEDFDFAITGLNKHRPTGEVKPYKSPPVRLSTRDLLVRNPGIQGSNLIVRRDLWRACGGFDEALRAFEDMDLGIRLLDAGARYRAVPEVQVGYDCHEGARLTMGDSLYARQGARRFLAKWGHRMSSEEQATFRDRACAFWGEDPGSWQTNLKIKPQTNILWLCGPPGAGKTTHAMAQPGARVVDLGAMLAPLQQRDHLTPGMRTAKVHIIEAIRAVGHRNITDDYIICTLADAQLLELLWPARPKEQLVVLLPEQAQWHKQLTARGERILPGASLEAATASYHAWQKKCMEAGITTNAADHKTELLGLPMDR